MIILWGDIVTVAVLGFIVLRKGRDETIGRSRLANWLVIAGLLALSLQVVIHLISTVGELTNGGLSGARHLLPAVVTAMLALLVLRRPLEGGVGIILPGALDVILNGIEALLITWPLSLSGLLFIASAVLAHNTNGRPFAAVSLRKSNRK